MKLLGTARALAAISVHEHDIRAFVPGTLDLDRIRVEAQGSTGPLAGMLLGVKDIINVDGFPTRCGSRLPPAVFDGPEASCVTRLRASGATVVGKTETAEFAISDAPPTRNPRNIAHSPGGSSSGSAAAVAAGFCDAALGTQTAGSVIRPAAYCGVIGWKPTFGRVALDGVFSYSRSMDHVGVIATNLEVMAGVAAAFVSDWAPKDTPGKLVLAVPDGPYMAFADPTAREHFERTVRCVERAGARVLRLEMFADAQIQVDRLDQLGGGELARSHRDLFPQYKDLYRPNSLQEVTAGALIDEATLAELRQDSIARRADLERIMDSIGIDAWICPAATGAAPLGLEWTGDYRMNSNWTHTGHPALTIPSGETGQGLPLGLQIVGRFGADEALLALAASLQV